MASTFPLSLLQTVFLCNLCLVILLLLLERRPPVNTLAWLVLLICMPIAGFVFYFLFGQLPSRSAAFSITFPPTGSPSVSVPFSHLMQRNAACGFPLTLHNETRFFTNGPQLFDDLRKRIQQAQHFIFLQTYIFADDRLGSEILQALTACARRGVAVYVLYDGMGCLKTARKFFRSLQEAGGSIAVYGLPFFSRSRLNDRNHRKIWIIDGLYGYIGGFNIADEYRDYTVKYRCWRDTHILLYGQAVSELERSFRADWRTSSSAPLPDSHSCGIPGIFSLPFNPIQPVFGAPGQPLKAIHASLLQIIYAARRFLFIQSPYFVPDGSLLHALKTAAASGVDIRIMLPDTPDHPFVFPCARSYMGELFPFHIRFFLYTKGFLHSKLLIADGTIASVGSANLDIRSFTLNFESNLLLYGSSSVQPLQTAFYQDLQSCRELTPETYRRRSCVSRLAEGVARLISPFL